MPWIKNDISTRSDYKPSKYLHEELPTWNEVYNEFWLNKAFYYDASKHSEILDPYLNIPYRKYLIAMICNQFNKNLYEDGYMESLSDFISHDEEIIKRYGNDLLVDKNWLFNISTKDNVNLSIVDMNSKMDNSGPIIYTVKLDKNNAFIYSKSYTENERINIMDAEFPYMRLILIGSLSNKSYHKIEIYDDEIMNRIIEFMMRPYIEYFEGEGIGWKDDKGNLVESENHFKCGNGFDAAL